MEKRKMSSDIRKEVEERKNKEAARLDMSENQNPDPKEKSDIKITSRFINDCLYANELGDGMLYATIQKDKFIFNQSSGAWMLWAGHYWEDDIMNESLSAVEDVALYYLKEASDLVDKIGLASKDGDKEKISELQKTQKAIYKRVERLRSDRGRNNCLKFAHTNPVNPLSIEGDIFDTNPMLFGCKNGVINLHTGKLRPGRQDEFISKSSPIEYHNLDIPAPLWEKTLQEIFKNNQKLIDYLARVFGYSLTGLTIEEFLPVFFGQGRNGKSLIVEIISHIMGSMAAPIQSEMLLDQGGVRSSASASPDIMALKGLRLAFASETDQGRRFSTSRVKWLTGSDTLIGRYLYDKRNIKFKPTHTLILLTNHKPDVSDDDFAFWERVHLILFDLSFVNRAPEKENERLADKNLRPKLLKEASGILSWLVAGCLEWQRQGLNPPDIIVDATKEYRRNEDLLGHFLQACCYEEQFIETSATELYEVFKKWWEVNVSRKVLSQKHFGNLMVKKFHRSKSGIYKYFGVGILSSVK